MSSSRLTIIGVAVVVVVAVALSLTGAGDDSSSEVVKKIDALEQRIASLEKTLNTRLVAIEKGIKAGTLVGQLAKLIGGGGGGRPNLASAGGRSPEELDAALEKAAGILSDMLNQ